jgi:quinol monooxygenase YgiN
VIVFTLRLLTNPQARKETLRNLTSLLGPTRVQPGCTSCRLYGDIEEPKAILLVEEWVSQVDLEKHLQSDDYRLVLETIELSDPSPEVHFDTIVKRSGLEVIESARMQKRHMYPHPQ